jgi:UDP-N-acetylglucosamine 2-epimerase (non-hydrolysing)
MKKILVVFGTRPEAIKMAPLVRTLKLHPEEFEIKICVTAQHRQMLDQVLQIFEIEPDIDLDLMTDLQSLSQITSSILTSVTKVLTDYNPDFVLVHGDTSTTMAAALAAFYSKIKVGHVEAGLRTGNINAPYPEEFNRITVSSIAEYHFAPTEESKQNLLNSGVNKEKIFVTGNTVVDALHIVLNKLENDLELANRTHELLSEKLEFDWQNSRYILITGHRRENFGEGINEICKSILELSLKHEGVHFIYPVHLNPNIKDVVYAMLGNLPNVHLLPPVDYLLFTLLLRDCFAVLTDSGGLQEEAPTLGKPLLLMREVTERPEGIRTGNTRLVGTQQLEIVQEVDRLLMDENHYKKMATSINPYGNGDASLKIIEILKQI